MRRIVKSETQSSAECETSGKKFGGGFKKKEKKYKMIQPFKAFLVNSRYPPDD